MQQHRSNGWSGFAPAQPAAVSAQVYWQEWTQRLSQAELQIRLLTERLADVQKQLDEVKSRPPMHVEYHFDQLKVNRLEGTLNVGISPQGIQGIESLETPDPDCWKVTTGPADEAAEPIRELQREMATYMDLESPRVLSDLEDRFGFALDEERRLQVIEDVKRQLNDRVHYYARKTEYPPKEKADERARWRQDIKDKTARDIQGAFSAYLSKQKSVQNVPKGGTSPA